MSSCLTECDEEFGGLCFSANIKGARNTVLLSSPRRHYFKKYTHARAQLFHSSCAASLSHLDVEQSLHTCSSKRSGRALLNALLFLPLFYSSSHPSFLSIHLWLTESCIWAIKCNIRFSNLFKCIIELLVRVKHRHCTCSTQRNRPNSALTVLPVDPTLSVFRTLWVCFTLCSRLNVSETFILLLHSKLCTCWTFCRVHHFPGLFQNALCSQCF